MSRSVRSAIAAVILLMMVGILLPDGSERGTPTSFGTYPHGYGALFELLVELGFPVTRNFDPPDQVTAGSAVWWIAPDTLCVHEDETAIWELTGMLDRGGTAVVFPPRDCPRLGALEVPERSARRDAAEASEEEEKEESDRDLLDRWLAG